MNPPTPISRDELASRIRIKLLDHNMPPSIHADGDDSNVAHASGTIMALVDFYVAQEVAEARRDELEMAILMKGKSLVRGGIIDTSSLEGGQPNMIDARILEARLASLSDPEVTEKNLGNPSSGKAAPLPKPKEKP